MKCEKCQTITYIPTIRKQEKGKRKFISLPIQWCDACKIVIKVV